MGNMPESMVDPNGEQFGPGLASYARASSVMDDNMGFSESSLRFAFTGQSGNPGLSGVIGGGGDWGNGASGGSSNKTAKSANAAFWQTIMNAAHGTTFTNNGDGTFTETDRNGMVVLQEIVIRGTPKKTKSGPGFFGKIWGGFMSAVNWLDKKFAPGTDIHERHDKDEDKTGGGIMWTGKKGNYGGARIGLGDGQSESVDPMMYMFGDSPSGGVGQFDGTFDKFSNFLGSIMGVHDATSQLNDVVKPYLNNDTMGWFLNPDGRSSDLRGLSKDSLKFYHQETYRDSQGYYGNALQLNH
jgi:hypothetical protein